MIPRTVQMAAEVAAQLTTSQLEDYGNIILNGYLEVVPNTINKKRWQYKETATAPINLPSLTQVTPALKGWTTNYQEYYTQLQPNGYGVNPGDPTMFAYNVHSFTPARGGIVTVGSLQGGSGYTPGTYTNVPVIDTTGSGATLNIIVSPSGVVISATLNAAGTLYAVGDGLTVGPVIGPGTGFNVAVAAISPIVGTNGAPTWARPPRRLINATVAPFVPPNDNRQAIQYSGILYPVADSPVAPPIDVL